MDGLLLPWKKVEYNAYNCHSCLKDVLHPEYYASMSEYTLPIILSRYKHAKNIQPNPRFIWSFLKDS